MEDEEAGIAIDVDGGEEEEDEASVKFDSLGEDAAIGIGVGFGVGAEVEVGVGVAGGDDDEAIEVISDDEIDTADGGGAG